jgi:hypothetical protein
MKNYLFKNRFTLLLATLTVYLLVMVVEGAVTGRRAQIIDFENPFFDLNLNNIEQFIEVEVDD